MLGGQAMADWAAVLMGGCTCVVPSCAVPVLWCLL